ncbi:Outer membrane protein OmpA [Chitinophaga sp. YR573]|nr:Outer membrane protein OmpA [Chitinophaga sp. YR573]
MIRFFVLVLCVMFLFPHIVQAQEQKSTRELADEAYEFQQYPRAVNLYNDLVSKSKNPPLEIMGKLANSYLKMGTIPAATYWYENMLKRPESGDSIRLIFIEMLKRTEDYKKAKEQIALLSDKRKAMLLAGCDSAVAWKSLLPDYALENIKDLCTQNDEWISGVTKQGLLIEGNGYRKMGISGKSESHPNVDERIGQPYFKSYMLKQYIRGNANNVLDEVIPSVLGRLPYNIGPVCFNAREDTAYVTINQLVETRGLKQTFNLLIFRTVKDKDGYKWKKLEFVRELNYKGSSSSHAVINREGNVLYFVSDRPGGSGKSDIWYSERQADHSWGTPKNCGPVINTSEDEACPTINEYGYLYFSSKGHPGMGGYDIFRVAGDRATWDGLQNLRSPVNSGGDDMGFILRGNDLEGFFSSNRLGGMGGDDVYHFMDAHLTEKLKQPDTAKLAVVTPETVTKPTIKPEIVAVKPPAPDTLTNPDKAVVGRLEKLRFLYDYNSAVLLDESKRVLDNVAAVLKERPNWRLIIKSYADSRGSDSYNLNLTAQRCYAVIAYLTNKGISPKRFSYQNMGEKDPINPCSDGVPCTESQHQENRRTELTVVH